MTRKPDTASALASILRAKRSDDLADTDSPSPAPPSPAVAVVDEPAAVAPPAQIRPAKPRAAVKLAEPSSGKRNDPDYCQANAYVPKSVKRAVNKALLDTEGLDYSTLVTDLLRKWLKSRGIAE